MEALGLGTHRGLGRQPGQSTEMSQNEMEKPLQSFPMGGFGFLLFFLGLRCFELPQLHRAGASQNVPAEEQHLDALWSWNCRRSQDTAAVPLISLNGTWALMA